MIWVFVFYEDHYTAHPSSSSLLLPLHKIFWYIVACGTFLDKYIFLYIFLHFKQTISKKYKFSLLLGEAQLCLPYDCL